MGRPIAPKNSGARSAAFEILLRVERGGAFASVLLEDREQRLTDDRDAALLHELVLGVLRRRAVLDHVVGRLSRRRPDRLDEEVRTALRIGLYGLFYLDRVPDFAAVDSAVNLIKNSGPATAAGFVNGVLRAAAREGRALFPPAPQRGNPDGLADHLSHPRWWVRRVVKRLGWDGAVRLMECNNLPARTVLRVNRARGGASDVLEACREDRIEVDPCRFVPDALRVRSGRIRGSRILERGLAWVQDEAAQLVCCMFGSARGPLIADLCAAPGGKTLQLAQGLRGRGLVAAVDRHPGRLRRLVSNVRRAGVGGVVPILADVGSESPGLRPSFHQVLLDAPCSGTGTLRRRPEIRWRLREKDLTLLASNQERMLGTAANLLVPGGRLVYAVCSIEPEEGEDVVRGFLRSRPRFRAVDPRPGLPEPARSLVDDSGFLRTSPATGGLDGFFAALLELGAGG